MGRVPQLEQHGVYLLRGGRYASGGVHAGGLPCFTILLVKHSEHSDSITVMLEKELANYRCCVDCKVIDFDQIFEVYLPRKRQNLFMCAVFLRRILLSLLPSISVNGPFWGRKFHFKAY